MYNRKMDNADRRIAFLFVSTEAFSVRLWSDGMKKFPKSGRFRKEYERALVRFGKACERQRRYVDCVTKEPFE